MDAPDREEVMMTSTAPPRRPSVAARRFGYTLGAVVNTSLLYVVNIHPGWQAAPFLTGDARQVLALVNLSLLVGLVANIVYAVHDPPSWKAFWDLLNTSIALAVLLRVWDVFPFAFTGAEYDWALVTRVVLIVSTVGTVVAIIVQLVSLLVRLIRSASGTLIKRT
jgi:hypothetical protein